MQNSTMAAPPNRMLVRLCEDRLLPHISPGDRECHLQDRHGHGQQRCRHAEQGDRFLAPDNAEATEQKTDQQASAIAQEDGSRIEVIAEKPEQGAGQRHGRDGQGEVALDQRFENYGEGRQQTNSASQPVEAVDQIERVGAPRQPQQCQRDAPPVRRMVGDAENPHAGPVCPGRACKLPKQFLPRLDTEKVVNQPRRKYDAGGRQKAPDESHVIGYDPSIAVRKHQQEAEREEVGDSDGNAAHAGNCRPVELTRFVGPVHEAKLARGLSKYRRYEQRRNE
jgi:hypothetical protein